MINSALIFIKIFPDNSFYMCRHSDPGCGYGFFWEKGIDVLMSLSIDVNPPVWHCQPHYFLLEELNGGYGFGVLGSWAKAPIYGELSGRVWCGVGRVWFSTACMVLMSVARFFPPRPTEPESMIFAMVNILVIVLTPGAEWFIPSNTFHPGMGGLLPDNYTHRRSKIYGNIESHVAVWKVSVNVLSWWRALADIRWGVYPVGWIPGIGTSGAYQFNSCVTVADLFNVLWIGRVFLVLIPTSAVFVGRR